MFARVSNRGRARPSIAARSWTKRPSVRSRVLALAVMVTIGACAALAQASGASGGSRSAAVPPRCSTSRLRLVSARQGAAVGRIFWELALRNVGPARCSLRGYPGVGLLGASGRVLSVAVKREARQPVGTVSIARGRSAYFTVAYEESGPCLPHFFSAYGLAVYPPGSTSRLLLRSAPIQICAVAVGGSPAVTPVRATLEP